MTNSSSVVGVVDVTCKMSFVYSTRILNYIVYWWAVLCDYIIGKIAWTIDGGSEVLGGLLVSDNGHVAVCDTPTAPVQTYTAQPAKEIKIHVFDLKVSHFPILYLRVKSPPWIQYAELIGHLIATKQPALHDTAVGSFRWKFSLSLHMKFHVKW